MRRPAAMRMMAIAAMALAGCASVPSPEELSAACATLKGATVPAPEIGLPSRGATITSAERILASPLAVKAGGNLESATPANCRLLGELPPTDPAAPPIRFQLNLPLAWNGKALQYGGGGLNGVVITGLAPLRDAPAGTPTPLERGYLTYGTDSGHRTTDYAPTEIGAWALNDEALVNFAHASYKKVRDVAVAVAARFYGRAPARVYFFGGSEGGREGLTMAQRYPRDFDGVVSVVPVVNWVGLMHAYQPSQRAQLEGGWLPPEKVALLGRAVTTACDGLDGLADGVVNNYHACAAIFDPAKLRCEGGRDTGPPCLSDLQLRAVASMHEPLKYPYPHANGVTEYPRWLWGVEDVSGGLGAWVTGANPPAVPPSKGHSIHWTYGNNVLRYFIARDAKFDPRNYDPARFRARVEAVSSLMDSTDPDLSAFEARGGKILLRENMGDYAQSPMAGVRYWESVVEKMGEARVEGFLRLYASSASTHTGHGRSLTTREYVPTSVDLLSVLEGWVERAEAPADTLVQVLNAPTPPFATLASRPLCRYPGYPHFNGYRQQPPGDPKAAASWACRDSRP